VIVCGVEYITDNESNKTVVGQIVPIAGDYYLRTGKSLESEVFRLKDSGSNADSEKEGVRVELSGGRQPLDDKKGKKQKAIIEFICDRNTDGKDTEVDDRPENKEDDEEEESKLRRSEEEKQKSLRFLSYKDENIKGDEFGVLRLEWNTKYACEDWVNQPREHGAHWGFFTWLIIMYVPFYSSCQTPCTNIISAFSSEHRHT
jgi:hypothetical protein